jgi:hypothetical protein
MMSAPRSIAFPSTWLPELANRWVVHALLALGLVGALAELVSTVFVPRLVLYLLVLAIGAVGLVRRRRADAAPRASRLAGA